MKPLSFPHRLSQAISSAILLVALGLALPGAAEGLRGDGDLALPGNTMAAVLRKCGEPFFVASYCRPLANVVLPDGYVLPIACEVVDEWSYNPGEGQFYALLRFTGGVVKEIRFGDRVR